MTRKHLSTWGAVIFIAAIPIVIAANSPLLQWRDPVYIAGGFAGIIAMALLLFQPLLAAGRLPGLSLAVARRVHRWLGAALILSVFAHIGGLWITSPPDVVDALLFRSPTPFAIWGVIAMWALIATAILALARKRFRQNLRYWRAAHSALAIVIVSTTAAHAVMIEGAMGTMSKAALSGALCVALLVALNDLRVWKRTRPGRGITTD
ncbi:ferric reductase-like transmembrane domain-containing protein [Marivita hallyeonensis]|uniref:Ferric reductase like transmembrane component n=1 Tax=Marivita hallyeonensis TaxID=996342 RepID=A0A1M5MK26_9RHOB|nr:ferric reductase-like transmembrane domain-containing protein [Marivita hallyeonensis]SHG77113.1 Ferric reductase like transmembrane component [Marivita hallyeonensis]